MSKLALYFDDPPISVESDGRGLNQVNARICSLFNERLTVVVNVMRLRIEQQLADLTAHDQVLLLRGIKGTVIKAAARISSALTASLEKRLVASADWDAVRSGGHVFAPVGSDIGSIRRALLVARKLDAKLLLYLVDDPLGGANGQGGRMARARSQAASLAVLLSRCAKVFCITEQLRELVQEKYGVEASHLPLPYDRSSAVTSTAPKNQIIYIGSINEIYAPELKHWIDLLDRVGFFSNGKLLLTGEFETREGVVVRSFPTMAALHQEIASSRACLLPISSQLSDLCYSSFPSKLLDYLGYGRLILASAPRRSVTYQFFEQEGLEFCFEEGAICEQKVRELLHSDTDLSQPYQEALERRFSGDQFRRSILDAAGSR